MDEQNNSGILHNPRVAQMAIALIAIATALLAVELAHSVYDFNHSPTDPQSMITVSGEGKSYASPDIATISFSVSEDAATVSAAQDSATKKTNASLAALKGFTIAEKDIQTSSYNVYPRYSTPQPCVYSSVSSMMPVPPCASTESKIIGYTVSQTVTVKVRNLDTVGDIVTALGKAGISNLYGPDFTVENPDAVQAEARALAIADAKAKAQILAKDLGVRIVKVTSYSEGGGYYPMYNMKSQAATGMGGAEDSARAPSPSMPTGQNQVTVNVSVTYEIR